MGLYVHVSETQQHCCWKQDKTWDFVFALREKPLINIDSQTTMTFCWRPCMYNSKINCQHGHESLTLICSLSPNSMHIGKIQTTDKTGYLVALLECFPHSWWRHQMETFSALLALCAGNSPVTGEFPAQRPVTRSFDVFFDLRPNKRLSKQPWGWWFETPSWSLWRQCNVLLKTINIFL